MAQPVRGWNTWNNYQCNITEDLILRQAQAIVDLNLSHLYNYIVIDDCWMSPERSLSNELQADPNSFPNGMKSIADKVHDLGLKIGLYTSIGETTCEGLPASHGYYYLDAATISGWGFDFLKVDTCGLTREQMFNPAPFYEQMGVALKAQERDIVYNVCNWGIWEPWIFAGDFAASWRTTTDIFPTFWRVLQIVDYSESLAPFSKPGHYNDLDMLEVGVSGTLFNWEWTPKIRPLTHVESKTHLSLWAIMNSPIVLGLNLASPDLDLKLVEILSNEKLLNLQADPMQRPARRQLVKTEGPLIAPTSLFTGFLTMLPHFCFSPLGDCTYVEIWTKPLSHDALAVMVFNRGSSKIRDVKISLKEDVHYSCENLIVEDVWNSDFSYDDELHTLTASKVAPQGSTVFILTPSSGICSYNGKQHIDANNFKIDSNRLVLLLLLWFISLRFIKS
mmetsp:Transcript_17781/g.33098  ORF Transcript_17781/g.33098 Transcript_17781/m.33098 type:complete len:448 (-) Transcript_17781:48-1391(-)